MALDRVLLKRDTDTERDFDTFCRGLDFYLGLCFSRYWSRVLTPLSFLEWISLFDIYLLYLPDLLYLLTLLFLLCLLFLLKCEFMVLYDNPEKLL
jgi:hypothetical protein